MILELVFHHFLPCNHNLWDLWDLWDLLVSSISPIHLVRDLENAQDRSVFAPVGGPSGLHVRD